MFVRSIRLFFETENQYILLTLPILRLTRVPYLSDVSICSVVFSRIEEDIVKISHAILSITLIQLVSFLYIDCGMLQTIENGCGFVGRFFSYTYLLVSLSWEFMFRDFFSLVVHSFSINAFECDKQFSCGRLLNKILPSQVSNGFRKVLVNPI